MDMDIDLDTYVLWMQMSIDTNEIYVYGYNDLDLDLDTWHGVPWTWRDITSHYITEILFHDVVVGGFNPLKNMKVSWDDEIPNMIGKVISNSMVPVSTNQCLLVYKPL